MNTNNAIESLRTFAFTQWISATPCDYTDMCEHMSAFIHMCTAALNGEEWAVERLTKGSATYPHTPVLRYPGYTYSVYQGDLRIIRATDTTRPDGAIARNFEV